jgi:inactivated superfamily I helicase
MAFLAAFLAAVVGAAFFVLLVGIDSHQAFLSHDLGVHPRTIGIFDQAVPVVGTGVDPVTLRFSDWRRVQTTDSLLNRCDRLAGVGSTSR